jgi:hypothetical protein
VGIYQAVVTKGPTLRLFEILSIIKKPGELSDTALDDRGSKSRQGLGIFLFTIVSRPILGPIQPPIHGVPEAIFLGVKRPGREVDYSPPSSAEVKECVELYFHSPNTPSWRGAELKHRDIFTFTLPFNY